MQRRGQQSEVDPCRIEVHAVVIGTAVEPLAESLKRMCERSHPARRRRDPISAVIQWPCNGQVV